MRAHVRSAAQGELVLEGDFGTIAGSWREDSPVPLVGQAVEVEFDIDHLVRATDVVVTPGTVAAVSTDGNVVRGLLESVDEDGMGYLRLTPDCLAMLETDGSVAAGEWVQFRVASRAVGVFGGAVTA